MKEKNKLPFFFRVCRGIAYGILIIFLAHLFNFYKTSSLEGEIHLIKSVICAMMTLYFVNEF